MTFRPASRHLIPVLAAALALVAAGCGGDEEDDARLLTQVRSENLLELLDDAEQQFDDGECDELEETLTDLTEQVGSVENAVEQDLRTTLRSETRELVRFQEQCEEEEPPAPAPEPTVPPPTETVPPTVTETVPPTTTETEEEPEEEPEEPPEEPEEEPEEPSNGGAGGGVTPPGAGGGVPRGGAGASGGGAEGDAG